MVGSSSPIASAVQQSVRAAIRTVATVKYVCDCKYEAGHVSELEKMMKTSFSERRVKEFVEKHATTEKERNFIKAANRLIIETEKREQWQADMQRRLDEMSSESGGGDYSDKENTDHVDHPAVDM